MATLDAQLLSVLACPSDDHAPLLEDGPELVCSFCASRFPVRDGIPVLLLDEAVPGPNGVGHQADTQENTAHPDAPSSS